MTYSGTGRPHAIQTLNTGSGTRTFTYDANGAITAGQVASTARTLAYTSYDFLASATIGTTSRTFSYGPDRQRYRQVSVSGGTTRTYTYIGEHYVKEVEGASTEHKLYIVANGEPVAYVSDDGTPDRRYLHKDHLGSIATIVTNQNVAGREKLSYDAWGKRRHGTDWWNAAATASEERGYTGHEHLDNVTLIHMNGRVYDPQLARFTSPDPFVPAALYSQSYNRYAYVYNNPLKYIDPSGFRPEECRFWMVCKKPGGPSPWSDPVIPDPGFYFVQPGDYVYALLQEQMRLAEEYRVAAIQYNYLMSVSHPAAKTDQEGIKPTIVGGAAAAWAGFKSAAFPSTTAYRERGTLGTWGSFGRGVAKEIYNTGVELSEIADVLTPGGAMIRKVLGAPELERMEIADDELGGASVTESALFAAAAGRSFVNAGRKLVGGLTKRVAQALCCFAAGTLVATGEGLRPIEDLEVGDQVWARSEETQELALKPVTALIRPHERVIWTVVYEIDEGTAVTYAEFDTTDDHPWASTDGTWLRTDELKPGMQIQRAHGVPARVMSVVETGRTEQTYNLEVADFHTYFVGEAWVWVHNAKNCVLQAVERTHGHHSDPKFMGGNPNQALTELGEGAHRGLHGSLNKFLRTVQDSFGNHMRPQRGNSGQTIRQNFSRQERLEALRDFYRGPGAQHTEAARDFFRQHPNL